LRGKRTDRAEGVRLGTIRFAGSDQAAKAGPVPFAFMARELRIAFRLGLNRCRRSRHRGTAGIHCCGIGPHPLLKLKRRNLRPASEARGSLDDNQFDIVRRSRNDWGPSEALCLNSHSTTKAYETDENCTVARHLLLSGHTSTLISGSIGTATWLNGWVGSGVSLLVHGTTAFSANCNF
jgi:hypothetical protein